MGINLCRPQPPTIIFIEQKQTRRLRRSPRKLPMMPLQPPELRSDYVSNGEPDLSLVRL